MTSFSISHSKINKRWGTARTLPIFCVILCIFVLFYAILCCSMQFCVVLCISVLFYVFLCRSLYCFLCMCTELLPPGGYPIAVKYIISYHIISYHIKRICSKTHQQDCLNVLTFDNICTRSANLVVQRNQ
jgi:hypothetical protein